MNNSISLPKKFRGVFLLLAMLSVFLMGLILPAKVFSQKSGDWKLEKMPTDLEKDFALSALPPHLRKGATVYLMDPEKGYYVAQKGTNGFICFITRTEWEWADFRKDLTMPISFDAEGARTIFPVYHDVAIMRASGKYTALQVRDTVIHRIKKGIYKAPARTGVSYMLAPLMRGYPGNPGNNQIMTMSMPHYMFYAPYLNNADVGGTNDGPLMVGNPDNTLLGDKKGPFGYIILPAGEKEQAQIVKANADLLKRLAAYKSYYKIKTMGM